MRQKKNREWRRNEKLEMESKSNYLKTEMSTDPWREALEGITE